jgi:hypothetical protein
MKPDIMLSFEFVESIPDELKEQTLYISVTYCTAVHKCCCGCGREVVTPLSPTAWQLTFDGKTVSLYPSIGSWSLPCQSHYFITKNKVIWARKWTKKQIASGREQESWAKQEYYAAALADVAAVESPSAVPPENRKAKRTPRSRVKK